MPGYKRKAGEYGGVSKKAKKSSSKVSIHKTIERQIMKHAELNELLTQQATYTPSSTAGTVACVNVIAEGDDIGNRRGRRITTRALDIIFSYQCKAANAAAGGVGLVALVYDGQPDGTIPTYSAIMDVTGCPAGLAMKNTAAYKDRFTIAWVMQLPEDAVDQTDGYLCKYRKYYKVPEKLNDVRYAGSTATTPLTGAWYLIWGDSINTTTNANIAYNVKYQYSDY